MNNTAFAAGRCENTGALITYNANYVGVLETTAYRYIDPAEILLKLFIPPINKWISFTPLYSKDYTALTQFTTSLSDLIFDLSGFTIVHTVPTFIDVKARGAITFTPNGGGAPFTVPVNIVNAFGTGLLTVPLSADRFQAVKSPPGIEIVAGNISNSPLKLKISRADLSTYLSKAGIYTFSVDVKTRSTDGRISDTKTVNFRITTLPMTSISIQNNNEVLFNYSSEMDYRADKSTDANNQLLISNNKAFEVYVKSNNAQFLSGGNPTTIPCSIVSVKNGTGETSVIGRTLSTTSQYIINGAAPALSRKVSLKYTIPASKAVNYLLDKQPNLYQLSITYSFTAR